MLEAQCHVAIQALHIFSCIYPSILHGASKIQVIKSNNYIYYMNTEQFNWSTPNEHDTQLCQVKKLEAYIYIYIYIYISGAHEKKIRVIFFHGLLIYIYNTLYIL